MVIISEKTHTETYRDVLKQFSTDTESAQEVAGKESTKATNAEANNFPMPDFLRHPPNHSGQDWTGSWRLGFWTAS